MLDFIRIACAVPDVAVADVARNAEKICNYIAEADEQGVDLLVFPELSLTGATCGDLFFEDALYDAVKAGLRQVVYCTAEHPEVAVVLGLPVRRGMRLYNCAAMIVDSEIMGLSVKTNLTAEEKRWFTSCTNLDACLMNDEELGVRGVVDDEGYTIPMNMNAYTVGNMTAIGVTFGTDLTAPISPAADLAIHGAEVIVSLDAAPEIVGSRDRRMELIKHQSDILNAVSAYCSAGMMESTRTAFTPAIASSLRTAMCWLKMIT